MIDQYNESKTGWALFSDDMTMRYRLGRSFTPFSPEVERINGSPCAIWVLCNPSDADASRPDPTVTECRKRSIALGADVLEVVNLWALRSPYPADLRKRAYGFRGDDATNDAAILAACRGAQWVIAGWGNHGELDHRAIMVCQMLSEAGIKLHHLGLTQRGYPKHPLARGVHRIPSDLAPIPWVT